MNPRDLHLAYDVIAVFWAACALFCLGKICALRVWDRAKKTISADPFGLTVVVPFVTASESILIVLAVMLRSPYVLVRALYRELRLQRWEKSPGIRQIDAAVIKRSDLLGAVCDIISGHPERARPFFNCERGKAIAVAYQTYFDELESKVEPQQGSQNAAA